MGEVRLLQVRVSAEEHKRLRVLCAELGISVAEYVRAILKEALGRDVGGEEEGSGSVSGG